MAIGGSRSESVTFYISTKWSVLNTVKMGGKEHWYEFQNMHFVTECGTGAVYIVGTANDQPFRGEIGRQVVN